MFQGQITSLHPQRPGNARLIGESSDSLLEALIG